MFYTYSQNNSGGHFQVDDQVTVYVIVEADSAEQADEIAESRAGIYFDGCEQGWDCECCGDRWYRAYDGSEQPEIYGKDPELCDSGWVKKGEPYCHIYYADGIVKTYRL
jgi:hypothetical protein